jgi:hypothetical protein
MGPYRKSWLTTASTNLAILVLAGILACYLIVLLLKLPQRIQRGEDGRAAIQMLDAMRRPFLEIKQTEVHFLQTLDPETANRELAILVDSANSFLRRYQTLARYSAPLSRDVASLSDTFQQWLVAERRLFTCLGARSAALVGTPAGSCRVSDLAAATDGFLRTMNELGVGETTIHADTDDGQAAALILKSAVGILLLYLIVLAFWGQRRIGKKESAFLQERLLAEQNASALGKNLTEALAKTLSGFISICASCKRVRTRDNEWTPVELYIAGKTDATFSHGVCGECKQRLYGELLSRKRGEQSP